MPSNKTKIILIDDHQLIRQGIRKTVDNEADMEVCAEADNANQALRLINDTNPDLAIIDISLNGEANGLELLKEIKKRFTGIKVLILSMHDETYYVENAIKQGASGYITKNDPIENVIKAIRAIQDGSTYLSTSISGKVINKLINKPNNEDNYETLTKRETEVFRLIGKGYVTSEISRELNMSVNTVESHRRNIKEKLGIQKGPDLLKRAIQFASNS